MHENTAGFLYAMTFLITPSTNRIFGWYLSVQTESGSVANYSVLDQQFPLTYRACLINRWFNFEFTPALSFLVGVDVPVHPFGGGTEFAPYVLRQAL